MEKWKIYNILNCQNNIIAGTTNKDSSTNYGFSLALHTGEDLEEIKKNREKFASKFPKNYSFVSFYQIHSNRVVDISNFNLKAGWYSKKIEADGMVTNRSNVVLTILTADCLALLMYDKVAKVIGAAHAGWRGVENNIAREMINIMKEHGAKEENILVTLSPSIRGCCYEVGEEVAKHFKKYPNSLVKKDNNKYNLDIAIANKEQLLELGINESNIEVSQICTSCQSNSYFSYRKECGCSGRFMSYIVMK